MEERREVEVDTELASIYRDEMICARYLEMHADHIHRMSQSPEKVWYVGRSKYRRYERGLEEAIQAGPANAYERRQWEKALADRDDRLVEADRLHGRRNELNAEYVAAGGWSRFFIVSGGHIHDSMNCSTCNNGAEPTMFGWLPELSGLSEEDAVKDQGALLCTVCFPSAPVEWTNQHELDEAAKQAASCAGSGTYAREMKHRVSGHGRSTGYATCPECGEMQSVTVNGKFRKHKKAKAS